MMEVFYLTDERACGFWPSKKMFMVQSQKHPERVALFWWIKKPGQHAVIEKNKDYDPYNLLTVHNDGSNTIKVSIGYSE